jgi:dTDP-4-dehydrorhamnose 3,5-epimerase
VLVVDFSEIEGVKLLESTSTNDSRGSFVKFHPGKVLFDRLNYVAVSINPKVGTIRGLHFQVEPFAEEKIVSCIQGSTFEVILDIRPNSKSFGKVATFQLTPESGMQVYLPKGIAHGFQTLSPETIVHYCLTSEYSSQSSITINPFGDLGIDWPIKSYSISEKDIKGASLQYAARKYVESLKV